MVRSVATMHFVITGAGQIGTQLASDLIHADHTVTVVRRSGRVVSGARLMHGDAGDRDLLKRAVHEADGGTVAIFHCIHTTYDSRVWAAELPSREQAVMDVAAAAGIPVIFPESVYAFGTTAQLLSDEVAAGRPTPASPLGEIRAGLLAARKNHRARTVSVVAADLVGPTADPASAVFVSSVFRPAAAGRTCRVLGDPDVPRSLTCIPDLTAAMVTAALHAGELTCDGDAVLVGPATDPLSQRQMADAVSPTGRARVRRIPWWVVAAAGTVSPVMRELHRQRYLWDSPSVLLPGVLESRYGVTPTPWHRVRDLARDQSGHEA